MVFYVCERKEKSLDLPTATSSSPTRPESLTLSHFIKKLFEVIYTHE
jgi:hypothetical protein